MGAAISFKAWRMFHLTRKLKKLRDSLAGRVFQETQRPGQDCVWQVQGTAENPAQLQRSKQGAEMEYKRLQGLNSLTITNKSLRSPKINCQDPNIHSLNRQHLPKAMS